MRPAPVRRPSGAAGIGATALLIQLAACAPFSPDSGMNAVSQIASAELGQNLIKVSDDETAAITHERVARLLRSPLSSASAVRIALLNNKGLQAAYNELGISEARFVAAALPPSPRLSVAPLLGASFLEVDASITADVIALLTLPARADIAEQRFRQAELRAAEADIGPLCRDAPGLLPRRGGLGCDRIS